MSTTGNTTTGTDYNVAIYLPDVDEDGLTVVDVRTLPAAKVAAWGLAA